MRFAASLTLLILVAGTLSAGAQTDPVGQESLVWIIEEEVRCKDQVWRETRDILIYGAGKLVLDGCTLVMAAAPYENQWLGASNEGLMIHVLLGGTLEMLHSGTGPAKIVPEEAPYGFRIDVNGVFRSQGTPNDPNMIRGLEGYMAEGNLGGGIRVFGNGEAYLNWTNVEDIQGPALLVQGGRGEANGVTVGNASGAFAAIEGSLVLRDVDLNTGIEGIRVNRADLTMERVNASSARAAVYATNSQVSISNSTLFAYHNAIVLDDSDLKLTDSSLTFGSVGLVGRHEVTRRALGPTIEVQGSSFTGIAGQSTLALSTKEASVTVGASTFANHSSGALSVLDGELRLQGSTFSGQGATDVFAADAPMWAIQGNSFSSGASRPVRLLFSVDVTVVDHDGLPVHGAKAVLGTSNGTTGPDGKIRLYWEPTLSPELEVLDDEAVLSVSHDGQSVERPIRMDDRDATIELGGAFLGLPALGPVALGLVLLALGLLRRRLM